MPLFFELWGQREEILAAPPCSFLDRRMSEPSVSPIDAYLFRPIHSNPVRAAYITSLESQISSLRDELATVYKTQGQNAQRLLAMNETLREKEELSRLESEHLRKSREEVTALRKKVDQHNELMAEKDRTAQVRRGLSMRPVYSTGHPSHFLFA